MNWYLTLILIHFIGLVMGFAVSISSIVMAALLARSEPEHRPTLARFMPMMSKVGHVGLALLWISGLILVFVYYGGFKDMPWEFYTKIAATVLLTIVVSYMAVLEAKISRGDVSAAALMPAFGKAATLFGLTALIFAVNAFN
ncbi:MAG: hypothetical protein AKCLJLPJ_00325 [Fimbriimonadales bacterium]|nr:hypothetical protein [Fimbriimonadales bacterium]